MTTTKTNRPDPIIVAGERASDLARAFAQLERSKSSDGMLHVHAQLDANVAEPLVRAIMRVEAELLQLDAAAVGTDDYENRTPEQRRADALCELAVRCATVSRLKTSP